MHSNSFPAQCHSRLPVRGFTLVELLVVVGIIAVLISFLLPALGRARESGYRVQCLSNLKNMYLGVALYNNMHQGKYPPPTISFGGAYSSGWPQILIYSKCIGTSNDAVSQTGTSFDAAFRPMMSTLFRCPKSAGSYDTNNVALTRTGSYAITTDLYDAASVNPVPIGTPAKYYRTTDVKSPGRFILLSENRDIPTSLHFTIDRPTIATPTSFRRRHLEGGNFVYADGHGEWHAAKQFIDQMNTWGVVSWPYYAPNLRLPFKNSDY